MIKSLWLVNEMKDGEEDVKQLKKMKLTSSSKIIWWRRENDYENDHLIVSKMKWNETMIVEMIDKNILIKLIFVDYFYFCSFYFILIKIKKMKRRMKDDEEVTTQGCCHNSDIWWFKLISRSSQHSTYSSTSHS